MANRETTQNSTSTIKFAAAATQVFKSSTEVSSVGNLESPRSVSTMQQSNSITVLITTRPDEIVESTK